MQRRLKEEIAWLKPVQSTALRTDVVLENPNLNLNFSIPLPSIVVSVKEQYHEMHYSLFSIWTIMSLHLVWE